MVTVDQLPGSGYDRCPEPGGVVFRVLGPMEIDAGRRVLRPGAPKQRLLLGLLLLAPDTLVRVDELIERLWPDGRHPADPRAALQLVVLRLRRLLSGLGCTARIHFRPGAYDFELADDRLDVHDFDVYLRQAADARDRRDPVAERHLLGKSLGLWRGPALGDDLPADGDRLVVENLRTRRMAAAERLAAIDIAAGRPEHAVSLMQSSVPEDPANERLRYQLILALWRSGRRPDALQAFNAAYRFSTSELGIPPGPDLRRLHSDILGATEVTTDDSPPRTDPVPMTLPTRVAGFVARPRLVELISTRLLAGSRDGTAICGLAGMPGIGKSALALHVAHGLRSAFPDGQLYVTFADRCEPATVDDVLDGLLRALGHGTRSAGCSPAERAGLFRTVTAGRRLLLLLDDVDDPDRVRALLPGDGHSAVLVTARSTLSAVDGSVWFRLAPLGDADATVALMATAGEERPHTTGTAVARVLGYCDGLPLALRIVGAKLAARPDWTMERMADHLADPAHRLDRLSVGDISVRSVLRSAWCRYSEPERRALRRLAAVGTPLCADAVARLVDDNGLEIPGLRAVPGTSTTLYRLHDLLALFVRGEITGTDAGPGADQPRQDR